MTDSRAPLSNGMIVVLCALVMASEAAPQHEQRSRSVLSGLIRDPSDAPVPGVHVVLAAGAREVAKVTTSQTGGFSFEGVPAGDYELRAAVAGFEPVRLAVRVASHPARPLVVTLVLASLKEEITVSEERSRVGIDPAGNVDAISVERSLLDRLPILDQDYLGTFSRFLAAGTPGDAGISLVVDGMEMRNAGVTPSAIQEVRLNNNPYTVEYPRWSRRRLEVITKASADRYHGTFNLLFRDHRLNARDALAAERPREQRRIVEGSLFGPVGHRKRTSFLLSGAREEEDLVAVVFAQGPSARIVQNVPTPQVNSVGSLRVTHEVDANQAMFWQVNFQDRWQNNQGIGGTTLEEAGTQSRFREDEFIFNHRVVLTPRLVSQFRVLLGRYWSPTRSNLVAPKVLVTDAFTGGGAQADRLQTEFHTSITWLVLQNLGRHAFKYGFNVPDWSRRGLRDSTNRLGTLFFASLGDYEASRPFSAVVQRGDPKLIFVEKNVGGFFQDEWQVRPNLSVAAGARYDWQSHFGDGANLAPRLAVAYSPGRSRNWVIRAGAGAFFDRSGPAPIWDILRYNGVRLRRYILTGTIPIDLTHAVFTDLPSSVHRLQPGVQLPEVIQFSAALERQLSKKTLFALTYNGVRAVHQLRSRDANAPLPPAFVGRPDSSVSLLRQIESAGRMVNDSFEVSLRGDLLPKVAGMLQYSLSKTMTDTGGVGWFPADSFRPQGEWGRADTDRRHQLNILATAPLHPWLSLGLAASVASAAPFNITTGRDDNRDGMALDRPAGVARNTGRGPDMVELDLRWYRELRVRPSRKEKSPSLTLSVDAFNVLNRVNDANYVGALSSPFFGRAVSTRPARRLQLGARFQF